MEPEEMEIRQGEGLDDVVSGSGYSSYSGMREAFRRSFDAPLGEAAAGGVECLKVGFIETVLGLIVAAVSERALCFLEFADRRGLEANYVRMRDRFGLSVVPGESAVLEQVRAEVGEYLAGDRKRFDVVVEERGTAWEERVWEVLRGNPLRGDA